MMEQQEMAKEEHYQAAQLVTRVGTGADTLLTLSKLIVGYMAGSAALVAEGFHSLADLLFDLVVLVSMHYARRKADDSHPYGHGKFESLATLLLAILLLGVAVGVALDAANKLTNPDLTAPGSIALWVAAGSMLIKEALFHYTMAVGKRTQSKIMIANAWHHRADAIASLAALVGIGGALLGWPLLDPLAAIVVAVFVGKAGVDIGIGALHELTDSAHSVDHEVRESITKLVHDNNDVLSAHLLKARRLGPDIVVDVHVVVNPYLSVSEGHQIADRVQLDLFNEVHGVSEVMVHVDTVDDQDEDRLPLYPDRNELMGRIVTILEDDPHLAALASLRGVVPHYRPEGIELEIFLGADDRLSLAERKVAAKALAERLLAVHGDFAAIHTHLSLGEFFRLAAT